MKNFIANLPIILMLPITLLVLLGNSIEKFMARMSINLHMKLKTEKGAKYREAIDRTKELVKYLEETQKQQAVATDGTDKLKNVIMGVGSNETH
jgi:hypothetical protein